MEKLYVIQWGCNGQWIDATQGENRLVYLHLEAAEESLNVVRNQALDWRIILRIEIVLD